MTSPVETKSGETRTSSESNGYRFRTDFGRRPPPRPGVNSGAHSASAGRFRNARSAAGDLPSRRLLFSVVGLTFVLPLAVAVALGAAWLRQALGPLSADLSQTRDELALESVGTTLRAHAVHAAQSVDSFFLERLLDTKSLASTPSVVGAVRRAGTEHRSRGFVDMKIYEVEAEMGTVRSLGLFPEVDLYLFHHLSTNPFFLEATLTDQSGYNVAMTHSAPDFVQRDELWWQRAWREGLHLGKVEYDRRAQELSMEIAVPVEDPMSGERLGVLKVVLGMNDVQSLMDTTAQAVPGIEISVFDPGGHAVADTKSGHSPDRIMSDAFNPVEVPADNRSGYLADGGDVVGFAHTAGATSYWSLRSGFAGLGWTVQVRGEPNGMNPALASLDETLQTMQEWPWRLGVAGAAGGFAVLVVCLGIVWLLVRRLSRAIAASRPDPHPLPHPVHNL